MAQTVETYTGDGSTKLYTIPFPYIESTDVKAKINGTLTTAFTFANATQLEFTTAPPDGNKILIFRQTDDSAAKKEFSAGSALKAEDLNANTKQALFINQESTNQAASTLGATFVGDVEFGFGNVIKFEGATDDAHETTLTVTDPTADRSLSLPNVSGTLVSTGDTGTITSTMILNETIESGDIKNGTIVNDDISSTANIANTKIADGLLKSTLTINSSNIVDGSIVNADINASADIQGSKLLNDSVTLDKLGSGALPTDITVASANIVDGTIVDADINSTANINGSKILNDSITLDKLGSGTLPTDITVSGDNVVNRSIKEEDIEVGSLDNRYYTETELDAGQLDNRYFTEVELNSGQLDNQYYTETELNNGQLDNQYYTETELNNGQLNNLYYTETELLNGALDGRYFTETEAEANFYRQDSSETISSGQTWSNSDAFVATTAAINARIIDLVDDVGGFSTIATELVFPNTNPQGTTGQAAILSVGALSQSYTPSGTTVTIANGTVGNSQVIITGVPSALPQGFGILVESTSTLNTYTFHRLVPKATEITTVAANATAVATAAQNVADINNFSDIYIISGSEPTQRTDGSSLQEGDLWFDSSNDNLLVYTGSAFAIITPSQSVLNDVAIVSGAITYSEDLGLITNAVTTGSSNGSLDIVADALEDEATFTVTASGGAYFIDGVSKPALTLYKGWTYTFDLSDSSNGNHPLRFYAGSSQYSTNVVVTGTQGQAGAKVSIKIPETQPTNFQYYCTNHSGMGNTITVKDDPIKTVSDNVVKIIATADNSSNINAVQANESNINAVQANASNINAAVSNASNINAAVSNASDISAVAGNNTNITAVANNETNINAVQANATNINAVNANSSNINTVAGNNSNITAVANNSSNINSAVSNASNINSAVSNASNINAVVSNATNINTVAVNVTDVNNFADQYQIASSAPSTDGGGNALSVGDLYFNSSANELRIWNGSQWQGGVTATGALSQVSGSVFTGDNRYEDNIKVKFGQDSDLQIFHNTTDSIINASGTGNIKLQDSGNTKLEVTSTGATVTGLMSATTIDGSAGNNLTLDFGTL